MGARSGTEMVGEQAGVSRSEIDRFVPFLMGSDSMSRNDLGFLYEPSLYGLDFDREFPEGLANGLTSMILKWMRTVRILVETLEIPVRGERVSIINAPQFY